MNKLRILFEQRGRWRNEKKNADDAHPEDEIQHEDHVLHARADVREVVAAPAIVHHRVAAADSVNFTRSASSRQFLGTALTRSLASRVPSTHGDETQLMSTHTSVASTRSAITTSPVTAFQHSCFSSRAFERRSAVRPFRVPCRVVLFERKIVNGGLDRLIAVERDWLLLLESTNRELYSAEDLMLPNC